MTDVSPPQHTLFGVHSVTATELMLHYDDPTSIFRGQRLGVVDAVVTADGLRLHPDPLTGNASAGNDATAAAVAAFLTVEATQSPAECAATLRRFAPRSNHADRVLAAAAVLDEPNDQVRTVAIGLLETHRYTDALEAARAAVGDQSRRP